MEKVKKIILGRVAEEDSRLASKVGGSFAEVMAEADRSRERRKMSIYRWTAVTAAAASVVLAVLLFAGGAGASRDKAVVAEAPALWNRISVPAGQHINMELPDGTHIYANSGTELEIPASFDASKREIRVSGEVFLNVAKDAARPFFVHGSGFDVQVYGTSFNVSAYPGAETAEVVLVEGSVAIHSSGETLMMEPGQKVTVSGSGMECSAVDTEEYTGWKDGVLTIHAQPISEVFAKLSRYYGTTLSVRGTAGSLRITGRLDLQDGLASVLDNICLLLPLEYTRQQGGQYEIRYR